MASAVRGAASLRRLLRKLPDVAREELATELSAIGARLLQRAKAETPTRTGRLRAALQFKVLPKTLRLRLGLLTKGAQQRFFYGFILDQGREARVVTAKRRTKTGISTYSYRVSPIARSRYEFVFGRRADLRANELTGLRKVLDRVLLRAAQGAGND